MKWTYYTLLLFLLHLGSAGGAQATEFGNLSEGNDIAASSANIDIAGFVKDDLGEALIGVNILVEGTSIGTASDFDGSYSLKNVPEDAKIIASYIGYETLEIEVGGRTAIDIILLADAQTLDELVVVGYGTVKKSDLTGSVQRVDASQFRDQSMTQLTDMLTGAVAGFNANQSSSAAGGSSLEIRGPTSLTGGTEPLVVLDGVIFNGSLSDINPNDIETVDILKDASSAAVFGSKAASGVILVTTTKGKKGKPTINFTTRLGVSQSTNKDYGVRGPQDYIDFRKAYYRGNVQPFPDSYWDDPSVLSSGISIDEWRGFNPNPLPDDTREYLSRLNFFPVEIETYLSGETIDWYDQTMQNGLKQEYDLSVAGGSDNSSYYWSVGYVDNEGIVRGDEFSTIRSRLNVDFKITDFLNVGANTQFSVRDESSVTADIGGMQRTSPYAKLYDDDGSLRWYPGDYVGGQNPLINTLGQDRDRKINSLFSSLYAKVKLPFGITYKISYQPRIESFRDYNYWSPQTIEGGQNVSGGKANRTDFNRFEWMVDNLIKWNKEIGIHNIDVTLLYNKEVNRTWESYAVNNTFLPSSTLGYSGLQFGINPALVTDDTKITGDAMMARVNYTLDGKYLFTGSVRRDGFSAFGQNNPRATFPAAAFAWKISDEDFFDIGGIDQAKLRVSWGVNGNRDIGAYSALAQLESNQYYDGTQVQIGVFTNTLANPGLVWEETKSVNIGLDLGILENRINVTLDYYDMKTKSLLVSRTLPRITGFRNITTNIGELANKGVEFTISSVNVNSADFDWRSTFNMSLNRNEIVSLFGESGDFTLEGNAQNGEVPDFQNEWFPGRAIDAVWNYEITGSWQEEDVTAADVYGLEPGDIKAVDRDNSGTYEALEDKTFIGFEQPRVRLGFRNDFGFLKNFSASIFIRADLGHVGEFSDAIHRHSTYDRRNTAPTPYWTAENRSNEWPRLGQNDAPYGGGIKVFKSREFVRVQDLTLNYSLPEAVASRAKLQSVRLFASVRNLLTFTKWPGWDPETYSDSESDPNFRGYEAMPKTYSVGINLSL